MKKPKATKAIKTETASMAQGLISMYKAGFYDGINDGEKRYKANKAILEKCKRAFEKRFVQVIK